MLSFSDRSLTVDGGCADAQTIGGDVRSLCSPPMYLAMRAKLGQRRSSKQSPEYTSCAWIVAKIFLQLGELNVVSATSREASPRDDVSELITKLAEELKP